MSYDDVEIEDMEWNEELQAYTYPCPCGDVFQITKDDLNWGKRSLGALAALSTSPSFTTSKISWIRKTASPSSPQSSSPSPSHKISDGITRRPQSGRKDSSQVLSDS